MTVQLTMPGKAHAESLHRALKEFAAAEGLDLDYLLGFGYVFSAPPPADNVVPFPRGRMAR